MSDNLALIVTFVLGALVGAIMVGLSVSGMLERKAAATECARYHPDTGRFEWLENKDE